MPSQSQPCAWPLEDTRSSAWIFPVRYLNAWGSTIGKRNLHCRRAAGNHGGLYSNWKLGSFVRLRSHTKPAEREVGVRRFAARVWRNRNPSQATFRIVAVRSSVLPGTTEQGTNRQLMHETISHTGTLPRDQLHEVMANAEVVVMATNALDREHVERLIGSVADLYRSHLHSAASRVVVEV